MKKVLTGPLLLALTLWGSIVSSPALVANAATTNSETATSCVQLLQQQSEIQRLQAKLSAIYAAKTRTRIIVPSLTFPESDIGGLKGVFNYETRSLWHVLLTDNTNDTIVFVSSGAIEQSQVDHLFASHPRGKELRKRVQFISLGDFSRKPLAEKLLEPKHRNTLDKIRAIADANANTFIVPFIVTEKEEALALAIGKPVLGPTQGDHKFGNKSYGRLMMEKAGIPVARGSNFLHTESQILTAMERLWLQGVRKAVVKQNEGVSGMGNAIIQFPQKVPDGQVLRRIQLRRVLREMRLQDASTTVDIFLEKMRERGGVVEEFILGENKQSPSGQGLIHPDGSVEILSTHEQILGGIDGQAVSGSYFSCRQSYSPPNCQRSTIDRQGAGHARSCWLLCGRFLNSRA